MLAALQIQLLFGTLFIQRDNIRLSMKTILVLTVLTLLLECNGESFNQRLSLNSFASRITSPTQTLLPPTFENPIKDYTVGLVPPPIDGQSARIDTRPKIQQQPVQSRNHIHSNPYTRATVFTNTNSGQQGNGHSAVHQQTHQSSNLLQPQVYQTKTAISQPFQHFTAHQHSHHHPSTTFRSGFVGEPVAQHRHHNHVVSAPQHYSPVTQTKVHQHSTQTHYAPFPVQRAATVVQYAHPNVYISGFVPKPVFSSGASIIQSYPSVSYTAIPQYGSTLDFGNANLDPELVRVIRDVYGQNH